MLFCLCCGAWASKKPVGLLKQCPGLATKAAGKLTLARIAASKHPDAQSRYRIASITPLDDDVIEEVRANLETHLAKRSEKSKVRRGAMKEVTELPTQLVVSEVTPGKARMERLLERVRAKA